MDVRQKSRPLFLGRSQTTVYSDLFPLKCDCTFCHTFQVSRQFFLIFEGIVTSLSSFLVLSLSVVDLGIFSMVSKSTRSLVEELYSYRAHTHFPHRTLHSIVSDEQKVSRNERYKQIGNMPFCYLFLFLFCCAA